MITSNFYVLEENKIPHQSAKDVNGMLFRTFLCALMSIFRVINSTLRIMDKCSSPRHLFAHGGLEIVTSWTSLLNAFNVKRNKLVFGGGVGVHRGR